ncbi:MAG: cyclic lactone autoinducer peptide [Epulopiscium sp.]|nr:cyclic lactone autoinducer peptide [Candidatus Epulonipiscium sp.]
MKKIKTMLTKPLSILCSLLILFAPLAITKTACFFLWGEPECPECLKESMTGK